MRVHLDVQSDRGIDHIQHLVYEKFLYPDRKVLEFLQFLSRYTNKSKTYYLISITRLARHIIEQGNS